jgi:hypothetical protein
MTNVPTLTKEECLPIMREAYRKGRLSAQGPTPACMYRDKSDRPCIVGSCFDDDVAQILSITGGNKSTIGAIITNEIAPFRVPIEDEDWFSSTQYAHDQWCNVEDEKRAHNGHETLKILLRIKDEPDVHGVRSYAT